jgi:hypothetical protein
VLGHWNNRASRAEYSWRHSGFNVDGSVWVRVGDAKGRENISRYLIRAPFSVEKITWVPGRRSVIYRTKMVKGPNRNFQVYDPLGFLSNLLVDRGWLYFQQSDFERHLGSGSNSLRARPPFV